MVESKKLVFFELTDGTKIKVSSELLSSKLSEVKAKYAWQELYLYDIDGAILEAEYENDISLNDVIQKRDVDGITKLFIKLCMIKQETVMFAIYNNGKYLKDVHVPSKLKLLYQLRKELNIANEVKFVVDEMAIDIEDE